MSRLSEAIELIGEEDANFFSESDPSGKDKYLKWMSQQKKDKQSNEDIIGTVKSFHRRSSSLKYSDIYQYKKLKDLENEILDLAPSRAERKDLKNIKHGTDYLAIIENKDFGLYYVMTFKGIKNLGQKTRWCIAANQSYWTSYSNGSDVYVVVSFNKEGRRFAMLHNRANSNYTVWNQEDFIVSTNKVFSPTLFEVIQEKSSMIRYIMLSKGSSTKKSSYIFSIGENKKSLKLDDAVKFVREHSLIPLLRKSKNKNVLNELKKDIKAKLSQGWVSNCSTEFFEVFSSDENKDEILEIIKTETLTFTKLKILTKVFGSMTKPKFLKMFNSAKYKRTKTGLLKAYPKYIGDIDLKYITSAQALLLLKKDKDLILQTYYHFGKNTNYGYDSSFTRYVKSTTFTNKVLNEISGKTDCPIKFKKYIEHVLKLKPKPIKDFNLVQEWFDWYYNEIYNNNTNYYTAFKLYENVNFNINTVEFVKFLKKNCS